MRSPSTLIVFAAIVAVLHAAEEVPWTKLSVKWSENGFPDYIAGTAFYPLPLTELSAQQQGWVVARKEEYVTLYCMSDNPRVCVLYDKQGNVAGVQVCAPVDDLPSTSYDWRQQSFFFEDTIFDQDVACGRFYLVSQETLKSGGRFTVDEIGTGVWLQENDYLTYVPQDATQVDEMVWSRENCAPKMGRHYYYNMSRDLDCAYFQPFVLLVDNQKDWLHGVAFQTFGKNSTNGRDWLDDPSGLSIKNIIPDAPDCLYEFAAKYSIISYHVYFIERPYDYAC